MEANTVILSLAEYNTLRDFKTEMQKGNSLQFYAGSWANSFTVISTDDALKQAAEMNEKLKAQVQWLEKKNYELQNPPVEERKEITLSEIRKMSIWQFRKWKKQ